MFKLKKFFIYILNIFNKLETLKKLERLKKISIFSIKEEISLKESQINNALVEDAFTPGAKKCYTFSTEEKNINNINIEYEKNNLSQNLQKNFLYKYDEESYVNNTKNTNYNSDDISSSNSCSDEYLSDENTNFSTNYKIQQIEENRSPNVININNFNINNTFVNCSLENKEIMSYKTDDINTNNINSSFFNLNNKIKRSNSKEPNNNNTQSFQGNPGLRNRNKSLKSTFKGVFNYVIGKDSKKDIEEEIEQLKILYNEMEMQIRMIKDKTILFRNKFISRINFLFTYISGKTLAFYCIYRMIMTIKNLLFLNYSDINVMLKEEVLNIIDFLINLIFKLLNLDVETIYYTVIEQYFSLMIVGLIIIINIRSFLNTILFIYTKTLKKYDTKINRQLQMVFLGYFVGLFYVTSSIFLIFNLPITYR